MKRSVLSRRAHIGVLAALFALMIVPTAGRATTIEEFPLNVTATGLAAAPDGGVYVTTDVWPVMRLSPSGTVTARYSFGFSTTGTTTSVDLPVFSHGSLWFRVTRVDANGTTTTLDRRDADGSLVEIPFHPITSLVADPDGDLWFAGPTGFGRVTPDGRVTDFPDPMGTPTSIAVDGDGRVWLTQQSPIGQATVATVSPDGTLSPTRVETSAWKVAASNTSTIVWLASEQGLCCAIGQRYLDSVSWLSAGTTAEQIGWGFLSSARLQDIAVGPDGNAWVIDKVSGGIGRISTTGRVSLFTTGLAPGGLPRLITAATRDALWFTDDGQRVGRVTLDRPLATTGPATTVDQSVAEVSGVVTPRGATSRVRFEYGTTTDYGMATRWQDVGDGDADIPVQARIDGLAPGTTYHYRSVVSSGFGPIPGVDRTLTTAPSPPPPPVAPADLDGDGYAAAVDCNDHAKVVYPGARDVPGDGIDQDCSGADEALARFFPHITQYFRSKRGRWSRFTELTIDTVPSGATIALTCTGRGCRFGHWTTTARRDLDTLALLKHLKGSQLGRGATLELRLTLADHIGTVVRWKIGPPPKPTVTCLPPGARKDRRC